jgi:hypothetical protein
MFHRKKEDSMFLSEKQQERKIRPLEITIGLFVLLAIVGIIFGISKLRRPTLDLPQVVRQDETSQIYSLIPHALGFSDPRTYLLLFINNTELRPAGGFIGSYAVVTVDKGRTTVHVIEGTESLDNNAPSTWKEEPPAPIKKYLGIGNWFFRDSNWSPDFTVSAQQAIKAYKGEEGKNAESIDTVVAVTPTVLEKMLEITGPVTVNKKTFHAETVTERLEYEVEYGFANNDVAFEDRKQILGPLMQEIMKKLRSEAFTNYSSFVQVIAGLADQKHILFYSEDEGFQKKIDANLWAGRFVQTDGDYLQWVDANLAALKTDHAIERNLLYSIRSQGNARIATANMHYKHTGVFDWRTSRYLSYVRIFVPNGSTPISIRGVGKNNETIGVEKIDTGVENGKKWFGAYVSIEPGSERNVSFEYYLPETVAGSEMGDTYTLVVQKQAGTEAHGLTLDLNFDTTIKSADPAEKSSEWGNAVYAVESDLLIDRAFQVILER